MHTFLWHDYETFGKDVRTARPAQFAAIRTDENLNEISEPVELFCQPAPDFLPEPDACLITGITPQRCLAMGIPEYQFAEKIFQILGQGNTIGVGYNTIRYDDEITRFMFWRNLIDPYAREWKNGCGRWDLIDLARITYALRPDGINWPRNDQGNVSFKLTALTDANGITHKSAHDAVSDVRATIALAKLLKVKKPKLFDFYLRLRKKENVSAEICLEAGQPFLHLSSMFSAENAHLALVFPLGRHPINKNEIIVWDCAFDPSELFELDAKMIKQRMFVRNEDLPNGINRLPIKTIHINKSPVVIRDLRVLDEASQERCKINLSLNTKNSSTLARRINELRAGIWAQVFSHEFDVGDVDESLYSGFIDNNDRNLLNFLRKLDPYELAKVNPRFTDTRLKELLFRYRARNFPDSLSINELKTWRQHCAARLYDGEGGALSLDMFFQQLERLAKIEGANLAVLRELNTYAQMIAPKAPK